MNTSRSALPYRIRSRSPRATFAFWTFALLTWVYSLVTGTNAKGATADPVLPDFYCVIVDRSGSMGPGVGNNNLVGPATEKLREFVAGLEPRTCLQIVFFDSEVGKIGRWSNLTPETKEVINRWIATEFRPSGNTRLFDTVGQVLTDILAERKQYGRIGLLVFSDGEDNRSTRFKSWAEIERVSGELAAQHPAAFMRYYTLGREPQAKPGAPWLVQEAPTAADLRKVVLEPAPEARFKILPDTPETGRKITFVVLPGHGRIESVSWNFGDGSTSSEAAVDHTYSAAGTFSGSLTVTGPGGSDIKSFTVSVIKPVPLTAAFSWFPSVIRVGTDIEFVDVSTGDPTNRRWLINDENVGTATRCSWHAAKAGRLKVRLDVTRSNEVNQVEHVLDVLPPSLDASFTLSPSHSVVLGTEITLNATGSNAGATHEWLAGGKSIGSAPALKWKPTTANLFEVTHRVTRGDETETATDRVQVIAQPPPAEFSVTPSLEVGLGQDVKAFARTTNTAWHHTFKLSTGETLDGASVAFRATHLGRVEIIHLVESPSGRSEAHDTVLVRDAVSAEFIIQRESRSPPVKVRFTPRSQAGIVSREWMFGDGTTSTDPSPSHIYTAPGEYRPLVKLRDVAGRELSYQLPQPISVVAPNPRWLTWAITISVVLAVSAAVGAVIWNRNRLTNLDGRLEWQFGVNRGRVELSGRQLDLGSLNVPGWKPKSAYSLVRRKTAGHQLLRDGAIAQAMEQDSSLEAEGVRLRLVP